MRWGWMAWKQSLAFNNDDNEKKKTIYNDQKYNPPTPLSSFSSCHHIFLWNVK